MKFRVRFFVKVSGGDFVFLLTEATFTTVTFIPLVSSTQRCEFFTPALNFRRALPFYLCRVNKKKRWLLLLLGIPSAVLLMAVIAAWLLGPRIKELAVRQINTYLTVPVSVDEISFSLIRKFPYASVDFSGVKTKGAPLAGVRDPLLDARHIYLQFSIWAVFSDDIRLKKITIEDAVFKLYVDEKGRENYDIFRKGSGGSAFSLELDEIVLHETTVQYVNRIAKRDYALHAKEMMWKGKFSQDVYDLSGDGSLYVERFKSGEVNYINGKDTRLQLSVRMDTREGLYEIRESSLAIADLNFNVDGYFREKGEATAVDLRIKSREAGLRELLSLIPGVYTERLKKYDYEGEVYFNLRLNGLISKNDQPLIVCDFGSANASLRPSGTDYLLNRIRFKGYYTNRISAARPVEQLRLTGVEAQLQGQPLKMDLVMEDFKSPSLQLSARSRVDLEVLSRFYMPDTLASMKGSLLVDARIRGKVSDAAGWVSEGRVQASGVSFQLKDRQVAFEDINGLVALIGNRLTVSQLSGKAAGSDFNIDGTFDNVYAWMLSHQEQVSVVAQLRCRNLDLNELLEDKSGNSADTTYRLDFSDHIRMSLGVNIGILSFRKFQAWQVQGTLSLNDKVLSGNDISFKAFEGHLMLNGSMDASHTDSLLIACDAELKKLDVTEMFTQLGNFGQDVIRDKNVKGKLTADVQFASTWSKTLHCNLNKVYAKSKLTIERGELNDFQPMLALSRYLKGADLQKVKFETLQNEIEISQQQIRIPAMEIKSSVMDLTMSGTHSFSNIVDYKLQLYLSQILGKKVRDRNTEFGTVEDDGLGRMRLYLKMKGPVNDPKITYDRKAIEQKITTYVKKEKQNLKVILNKEFGWFKKDTSVTRRVDNQSKKHEELEIEPEEE